MVKQLRCRSIVVICALALVVSGIPAIAYAHSFSDVGKNAWYTTGEYDYIEYVSSKKIMMGYTKTQFLPEQSLTRAEAVTALYRCVTGDPEGLTRTNQKVKNTTELDDVEDDSFYTAAVNWAYAEKIVTGYKDDNSFLPYRPIQRQELIVMLARSTDYDWNDAGPNPRPAVLYSGQYRDYEDIDDWAGLGVEWGVQRCLMEGGVGEKLSSREAYLRPHDAATRAEASKIFTLYCIEVLKSP